MVVSVAVVVPALLASDSGRQARQTTAAGEGNRE
jgi:hypothetical protein